MKCCFLLPRTVASLIFLSNAVLLAAPPPGYYGTAEGTLGDDLREALAEIIQEHTRIPYSWAPFYVLDRDPENPDHVLMIYSGFSQPHDSHHLVWNREHIWPRSRGLGSRGTAHDDLHNLKPCDPGVNSARGNLAFGYPDPEHSSHTPVGSYAQAPLASRDSFRWLPPEDDRGFIARAMFYMATRYNGAGTEPDLYLTDTPATESPWGTAMGDFQAFLKWNRRYPPDSAEKQRNQLVFSDYQGNRNPYIDFPDLVDAAFTAHLYLAPGTWRTKHFGFDELGDASLTGWDADPDGDGKSNLLEYAFGSNPREASRAPPVQIHFQENGPTTVEFRKVREAHLWGLNYQLEQSTDLITWDPVEKQIISAVDAGVWYRDVVATLPTPEDNTHHFVRVLVRIDPN
jgi:endonuclease I